MPFCAAAGVANHAKATKDSCMMENNMTVQDQMLVAGSDIDRWDVLDSGKEDLSSGPLLVESKLGPRIFI